MKKPILSLARACTPLLLGQTIVCLLFNQPALAQSCPANGTTTLNTYPNTYYPGTQSLVTAGSKKITLGAVTYGTTPISKGDILLVIQMQGAYINSGNSNSYGDGSGSGSGYLVNSSLAAGSMEYVVASNNVPLTGGTLNITTGVVNVYENLSAGSEGQYTFQVIRVPSYYDLQLTGTIQPPRWDGTEGGVVVLFATHYIDLNSQTVDASGLGFRGGGGRALNGGGSGTHNDYRTQSSVNADASKGEGLAGTPKYLNNSDIALEVSGAEGYPNGSYSMGAPGNAGGGGTDGNPSGANDQNTGGGGGGNGGTGGNGGNSWSSNLPSGGHPGAVFAQASASRLVMGGGGGAGTTNNATGTPANGFASSGSAGGGIIILIAQNSIIGSGTVKSNGDDANSTVQYDGAGGAGAGGSIVIYSGNGITSNISVQANGGAGGSNEGAGGPSHGPGGGGGGGIVYSNATLKTGSTAAGGNAGTTSGGTINYGATNGSAGSLVTTMRLSDMAQVPLNCATLAASFIDVTARPSNGAILVAWSITREATTIDYTIERSNDGVNFSAIASVPFRESNSVDNDYQYTDNSGYATGGTCYYRIRENESGGRFIYSQVVVIRLEATAGKLVVYPNPAKSFVSLSFNMTVARTVTLRLFNGNGNLVAEQQYRANAGQNNLTIDRVAELPDGAYLMQWSDGVDLRMEKVMVLH